MTHNNKKSKKRLGIDKECVIIDINTDSSPDQILVDVVGDESDAIWVYTSNLYSEDIIHQIGIDVLQKIKRSVHGKK